MGEVRGGCNERWWECEGDGMIDGGIVRWM